MLEWHDGYQPASLEERLEDDVVRCHLSPRNCQIKPGELGFCKVRGNVDGNLVTFNYGKGVHPTEEVIETEAVFHFSPGARILSLGNIGCMLNCAYCHNWKTSQAKYADRKDVHDYTPQEIVDMAVRHGITGLSWTYNDPVVWHEFVIDTARLAKAAGLFNLYKSAFFISEKAVEELLPHVDVFSISIKAMDPRYYRKITTGWLQPVLDATKQVYDAGKHVEISNLMVTDLSDDEETARNMAQFVLDELGAEVPLHFVRFHPDYRLRNSIRTPISRLFRARKIARDMGVAYVYLGNVYDADATRTDCSNCSHSLVERFGLTATIRGLDPFGNCQSCGENAHFSMSHVALNHPRRLPSIIEADFDLRAFNWHGDICSLHLQAFNAHDAERWIYHRRRRWGNGESDWSAVAIAPGESFRFIISKRSSDEIGPTVAVPKDLDSNMHEVFDRAHFPTIGIDEVSSEDDVTPFPRFDGKLHPIKES